MKVVGRVKPEEVPLGEKAVFGVWTGLAEQAIAAHANGEVLVVSLENRDEFKRMSNGMAERIRLAGYSRRFTAVDEPDGSVKVYVDMVAKEPDNVTSVAPPNRRPRKRAG